MTVVLAAAVLLTLGLLGYVFFLPERLASGTEQTGLDHLRERKDAVYDNLRDLNFEFKAGKFPEADYLAMRGALEDEAVALLAEIEELEKRPPEGVRV